MPEALEDPRRCPAYRFSRVLVWTQITLASLALVTILVVGATRHPGMWRGLEAGIIRSLIVLLSGVPLLWSIGPEPRARRLPVNGPGHAHTGRWLRIPLWTCVALGMATLVLTALASRVMPRIPLSPLHDASRCAVPTLAAALLVLPLAGRSAGWIRRCVPVVLLVPALWYAWTQVGGLLVPPTPSSPPQAALGRLGEPGPDEMEAAWRLGAAAWRTVRLAIALSLTTAALAFFRRDSSSP